MHWFIVAGHSIREDEDAMGRSHIPIISNYPVVLYWMYWVAPHLVANLQIVHSQQCLNLNDDVGDSEEEDNSLYKSIRILLQMKRNEQEIRYPATSVDGGWQKSSREDGRWLNINRKPRN